MRAVFVVVIAAVSLIFTASVAAAHSRLASSNPADGATVTQQLSEVTLTFNEAVDGRFSTVVVDGPGEESFSAGALRVIDNTVHQPVRPLRSGDYRVAWRVVSADGHPITGQFAFSVALPPGAEPSDTPTASVEPTASKDQRDEEPTGWWIGGAAVVLLVVAGVVFLTRRRRGDRTDR